MTDPITIAKLELTGFRAYFKPKAFTLHNKKGPLSLAVFAPNGKGKSSLVDSLEYYFSEDGSLKRLGLNSTSTHAGVNAIRHVDAERRKVETSVCVQFKQGNNRFGDSRFFSTPLTDAARRILNRAKVSFIIRGYELRRFIDDTKPTERYRELVAWFNLDPLLTVQENLKALKRQVVKMAADKTDVSERLRDLADATDNTILKWDEKGILNWLNKSVLAELDKSLQFKVLSSDDPAFRELESRKQVEQEYSGLETLKNLQAAIDRLLERPATRPKDPAGLISSFERSVSRFRDASTNESAARSATSESVFNEIWTSAKSLLESDTDFDKCPVCDTEFAKSPSRSRDGAYTNISLNLANLERYRKAAEEKGRAEGEIGQTVGNLVEVLERLSLLAGSAYSHGAVTAYLEALQSWEAGKKAPDSKGVIEALAHLHASVSTDIERIYRQQDESTYDDALRTVRRLLAVKTKLERIECTKAELRAVRDSLGQQIGKFDIAIVRHVHRMVGSLQDEVNSLYRSIQGHDAEEPRIQIKLAEEDASNQQSATLLIGFANRGEVVPGGYLSDSQMHTLALSIRLAAIRLFNTGVRIIALDDIVTSYDADHRKNIAAVLNDSFAEFQIILVTHDKQFFDMLRDHLAESRWDFKRIKKISLGVGPIFEDHKTKYKEIEEKLAAGESAGNDIRQAIEEWLNRICYDFETSIVLKRNREPSISDLAPSLEQFLNSSGLNSPKIPGFSKPFLKSLQNAKIENMSSHFGNNPYASLSSGDEKARWDEFKCFQDMFKCSCNGLRFERPRNLPKPICKSCKKQFSFEQQTTT